jgi:hypothetical protein
MHIVVSLTCLIAILQPHCHRISFYYDKYSNIIIIKYDEKYTGLIQVFTFDTNDKIKKLLLTYIFRNTETSILAIQSFNCNIQHIGLLYFISSTCSLYFYYNLEKKKEKFDS